MLEFFLEFRSEQAVADKRQPYATRSHCHVCPDPAVEFSAALLTVTSRFRAMLAR